MARAYKTDWAPLLERVMQEEIGLAVWTNNTHAMQIEICRYIEDHQGFTNLTVALPSIPDHVFLVNKSAEVLL